MIVTVVKNKILTTYYSEDWGYINSVISENPTAEITVEDEVGNLVYCK